MRKIWIAAFAVAVLASSQASAINTRKDWDGTTNVGALGCTNYASNYGQVITVPKFKSAIGEFSFFMSGSPTSSSMVVRAEIYQWDSVNQRAMGSALYESAPRTIAFSDGNFHRVTFHANTAVASSTQYIAFVTTDKNFDQCVNSYRVSWAMVPKGTYKGGHFYYLQTNGDPSLWTTTTWNSYIYDTAFTATLSVH